jgi:hypothetical protein
VILDTPGLNAIGAEPELTVSLLPQAHAVVFILAADTGVTKSDLTIWRQHLAPGRGQRARLVVLNKIDTMWDALSTPEQVQLQIAAQRADSAEMLGLRRSRCWRCRPRKACWPRSTATSAAAGQPPARAGAALGDGAAGAAPQILRGRGGLAGIQALRQETGRMVHTRRAIWWSRCRSWRACAARTWA